jgi:hypothetical protein
MKRVVLLIPLLVASCSPISGPTAEYASPVSACPVTAWSSTRPPDAAAASFTSTWYGNDSLWAGLDRSYAGKWYASSSGVKVLWYRSARGKLTVDGSRIDGSALALKADIPEGYGDTGIQASGLVFPSEGCWKVTGKLNGQEITFVVDVLPADQNPVK